MEIRFIFHTSTSMVIYFYERELILPQSYIFFTVNTLKNYVINY